VEQGLHFDTTNERFTKDQTPIIYLTWPRQVLELMPLVQPSKRELYLMQLCEQIVSCRPIGRHRGTRFVRWSRKWRLGAAESARANAIARI